jgi:hypothetical protein
MYIYNKTTELLCTATDVFLTEGFYPGALRRVKFNFIAKGSELRCSREIPQFRAISCEQPTFEMHSSVPTIRPATQTFLPLVRMRTSTFCS